jgi:hypothetical protein
VANLYEFKATGQEPRSVSTKKEGEQALKGWKAHEEDTGRSVRGSISKGFLFSVPEDYDEHFRPDSRRAAILRAYDVMTKERVA